MASYPQKNSQILANLTHSFYEKIWFFKSTKFAKQIIDSVYTKCWGSWYLIVSVFEFFFVLVEMCFQHSLMYRKFQHIFYSFSFSLKNSPFLFLMYYNWDGLLPYFPWNNGTKLFSFGFCHVTKVAIIES